MYHNHLQNSIRVGDPLPRRPPPPPQDDDKDEDEDDLLASVGFMLDAAHAKQWCTHCILNKIEVEVQVIKDEDGPGALQTGQYIWPAASFLANYLVASWPTSSVVRYQHIVELGSGCGLVGLTCAQIPTVASVCMTDHDPGTLALIREGIARNKGKQQQCENIDAAILEWGKDSVVVAAAAATAAAAAAAAGSAQGGDDKEEEEEEEEDELWVVGSDLIYSETVVEPLLRTIAALLASPSAFGSKKATKEAKCILCGSFALGRAIEQKKEECLKALSLIRTSVWPPLPLPPPGNCKEEGSVAAARLAAAAVEESNKKELWLETLVLKK